jgi:hypothetical protein
VLEPTAASKWAEPLDEGVARVLAEEIGARVPTDRIVTALDTVPDDAVEISEHGVLVGGKTVPVVSRWHASAKLTQHVRTFGKWQPPTVTHWLRTKLFRSS